jgi:hypothetical protein
MYSKLPNLVIGFHGCDISVFEKVLHNHENMIFSDKPYDWLGHGVYFWEHNLRAPKKRQLHLYRSYRLYLILKNRLISAHNHM